MSEHPSAVGTVWVADDGAAIRIYTSKRDAEKDIYEKSVNASDDESDVDIRENDGGDTIITSDGFAPIYIDEIEVYGNPNSATFLEILDEPRDDSLLEEVEDAE
jgi:hypothetical protein